MDIIFGKFDACLSVLLFETEMDYLPKRFVRKVGCHCFHIRCSNLETGLLSRHQLLDLTSQLTSCTTMKAKAREPKGLISKRRMRSILKRWKAKLGPPPLGTLLPIVR